MPILAEIDLRKSGTAIKFPVLESSFVGKAREGCDNDKTAIHLNSPVAQLAEQRTVNPCVPGSSPGGGAFQILGISEGTI